MAKEETEVLQIGVDIRNALSEMTKFQRETVRQMEAITKASEKMGDRVQDVSDDAFESTKDWKKGLEDVTKAYKEETTEIDNLDETIKHLEKSIESSNDTQQEGIKANLKLLRQEQKEKMKALKVKGDGYKQFKQQAEDAREAFKDSFKHFFNKDLKAMTTSLPKVLAKTFKMMPSFGLRMKEIGASISGRGHEKGGMAGAGMKGAGSAMKMMGGMMNSLKGPIEALSKLGPIIGTIGGAVVGLAKMFLDLDSKVKEFNKDILASASNAEFLRDAGGDASEGFERMSTVLKGIRDSAYSLENMDWGMKPEDHKAIINVLTQEGVSLASIGKQAGKSSEEVQAFTSELAHVSVAYSRAFGVPLQEINQLQAEMTQEMGIGLRNTALAFEQIQKSAGEAGVGANKFFSMIRGVSQDLSLWNNRMEDATVLLGKLMNRMSPRTAQSFFQTLQKGFKGLSRTDLLQNVLLGGVDKVTKSAQDELTRNIRNMASTIGSQLGMDEAGMDQLAENIKKNGRAAVEPLLKNLPDEMRSSITESLTNMELTQSRLKKGAYGAGEAMASFSPMAAAEVKRNIALQFSGKKNMADAAGTIGAGAMSEKLGISVEEYNHYAQVEAMMKDQRDLLKDKLTDPATQKKLMKSGIKGTKEAIEKASWAQVFDTMGDNQQDLINGVSDTEKMAKKQAKAQTSFYDQFDTLVNFIMNQVYNVLMGIWDAIMSIPGVGNDDSKRKKAMGAGLSVDLRQAMEAGDPAKALIASSSFQDLMKSLKEASVSKNPKQLDQFNTAITAMASKMDATRIGQAVQDKGAGIDPEKMNKFFDALPKVQTDMYTGKETSDSTRTRNAAAVSQLTKIFSPEELTKIMEKATVWGGKSGLDKVESIVAGRQAMGLGASGGGGGEASPPSGASPAERAPNAATPPVAKTAAEHVDVAKNSLAVTKDQATTLQSIDNQMDKFKMDTGFLNGPYAKATEGSVLAAVRTALFEYYMYKDMDQSMVASSMAKGGWSPRSFSQMIGQSAQAGINGDDMLSGMGALKANASGGVVTGVNNGIASVAAAAGEGLASVGPGERILPRGGKSGGDNYYINVQGVGGRDLAELIQARTMDTIYEYKRKQRFS